MKGERETERDVRKRGARVANGLSRTSCDREEKGDTEKVARPYVRLDLLKSRMKSLFVRVNKTDGFYETSVLKNINLMY